MTTFLEHANMTVIDIDETLRFLSTAFPDWKVRADNIGSSGRWVHFGSSTHYLAIEDRGATLKGPHEPYIHPGLNHLGFVVDELDDLCLRMRSAGYREGMEVPVHPARKRAYFFDDDGNEFEFVEYLVKTSEARNDYSETQGCH